MKYPLVIPVLCYASGILAGAWLESGLLPLLGGSIGLFLVAAMVRSAVALAAVVFACGWLHTQSLNQASSQQDLRSRIGEITRIVNLRGRLAETPALRLYKKHDAIHTRANFIFDVSEIELDETWHPAEGRVVVFLPEAPPEDWIEGLTFQINGVIERPLGREAPGMFDYRQHLYWKGIHYVVRTDGVRAIKSISAPEAAGPFWLREWRQAKAAFVRTSKALLARGFRSDDEHVRLVWALALGWNAALTDEVSEPFVRSGTLHVFAISGMHIAVIAFIALRVLRTCQMGRGPAAMTTVFIAWFYTFATGGQPSAVRSSIMASVLLIGYAMRRPSNLMNSLAAAALLVLLWDPRQLFHPGFQLSFAVVLALATVAPPLTEWIDQIIRPDPLAPLELRERPIRAGWALWRLNRAAIITTTAAWIGAAPITAYYFHIVSPVSWLANLIIVPLSNAALAASLGSMTFFFAPTLAEILSNAAWGFMWMMVWLSEYAAGGGWMRMRSPTLIEMMLFYIPIFAVLLRLWRERVRFMLAASVFVVLLSIQIPTWWNASREMKITCLPHDAGILVQRQGVEALIDCGSQFWAERLLKPFLESEGIDHLDVFGLTHGDAQHVGGAALVAREFTPRTVLASDVRFRSRIYRDNLEQLRAKTKFALGVRSAKLGWTEAVHPAQGDRVARADSGALVLKLEHHGIRILLLGDLDRVGQGRLLDDGDNLQSDVLILSGNDQPAELIDALFERIRPKHVIYTSASDSQANAAGIAERQAMRGRAAFINTNERGAAVMRVTASGGLTVRAMRDL